MDTILGNKTIVHFKTSYFKRVFQLNVTLENPLQMLDGYKID